MHGELWGYVLMAWSEPQFSKALGMRYSVNTDDAWGQARRMLAEKEHYRLAYEELRQKRGK